MCFANYNVYWSCCRHASFSYPNRFWSRQPSRICYVFFFFCCHVLCGQLSDDSISCERGESQLDYTYPYFMFWVENTVSLKTCCWSLQSSAIVFYFLSYCRTILIWFWLIVGRLFPMFAICTIKVNFWANMSKYYRNYNLSLVQV